MLTGIHLDGALQQAASVIRASYGTGSLRRRLARSLCNERVVDAWQSSALGHLGAFVVLCFVGRAIYGCTVRLYNPSYLIVY